jgi:hypothetical protein
MRWILLVPISFGLLGLDVLVVRRAVITRRNRAEYDIEYLRLSECFKAAQPKPVYFERPMFELF